MKSPLVARLPFLIIISALTALLITLYWPNEQTSTAKKNTITKVKTTMVSKKLFKDVIQALGTAKANEAVTLFPEYSAIVKNVFFSGGELFTKGQKIIELNHDEQTAKVEELSTKLNEANRQLIRLKKSNSSAQSTIEQQQSEVETIQAQLAQEQAILTKYTIRAPFTGVLGLREISQGALLTSSDKITTIDDLSLIKVDFTLPEKDLSKIKIQQSIEAVSAAYQQQKFTGKITHIDTRINPITRAVNVRALIDNKNLHLKPGMLLSILLERSVESIIQLPESAVIPTAEQQWVYVIKQNKAEKKQVLLGRRQPGIVEITAGLTIGDEVVIEGALKLKNGAKVITIQDKPPLEEPSPKTAVVNNKSGE